MSGVTHSHVSAIADDPTKDVSSGEWNDAHVIADATITAAMLAPPTLPTVRSVSAEVHATSGGLTPTLPAGHALNDILLIVVQSSGIGLTAPAGYQCLGPQNQIGATSAVGGTRLTIWWKRDGGAESDPTVASGWSISAA